MEMRTLREVYEEIGVSRTTLQGWVNGILGKPTMQDNTGWYFDKKDFEKIWQIRFFKHLRYSNKKIKAIFEDPNFDQKKCLQEQIRLLTKQKEELEDLIGAAQMMNDMGISPKTFRFLDDEIGSERYKDIYKDFVSILGMSYKSSNEDEEDNLFLENELKKRFRSFKKIMKFYDKGLSAHSEEVQKEINCILESGIFVLFLLVLREIVSKRYGEGKTAYFYNALQYYQEMNLDWDWEEMMKRIMDLSEKGYSADSEEVQGIIKTIYEHGHVLSVNGLRKFGELYGSRTYIKFVNRIAGVEVSEFISKAILYYCNCQEKGLQN